MTIDDLLIRARKMGASDVHVTVGIPPKCRVNGELVTLMEGRILNHKVVKPYRTQKIKVLRAQNASVDLDGRILDRHFPLDIGVLHEAITLIIPN